MFYYIKVQYKGVKIIQVCFRDGVSHWETSNLQSTIHSNNRQHSKTVFFFFFFSEKIRLDFECELSAGWFPCNIKPYFLWKKKKKKKKKKNSIGECVICNNFEWPFKVTCFMEKNIHLYTCFSEVHIQLFNAWDLWVKFSAENILKKFLMFCQKTGSDISGKLWRQFALYQVSFLAKIRKKYKFVVCWINPVKW